MSTTTVEIPHDLWQTFLNACIQRHAGWRLTVDVLGMEIGSQRAVDGLALLGLSLEADGSEDGGILIEAGDRGDALMIHHVDHPQCLRVADTLLGLEIDIQVESANGTTTILMLRRRPELPPPSSARPQNPGESSAETDAPMLVPSHV